MTEIIKRIIKNIIPASGRRKIRDAYWWYIQSFIKQKYEQKAISNLKKRKKYGLFFLLYTNLYGNMILYIN